jgi:hypothetical protein
MNSASAFWEKPLSSLDRGEWEALCDGCGRCCLHKLEDEDTGQLFPTNVACLLDRRTGQCTDYTHRKSWCMIASSSTHKLDEQSGFRRPVPTAFVGKASRLTGTYLDQRQSRDGDEAGQSTRGWTISEVDAGSWNTTLSISRSEPLSLPGLLARRTSSSPPRQAMRLRLDEARGRLILSFPRRMNKRAVLDWAGRQGGWVKPSSLESSRQSLPSWSQHTRRGPPGVAPLGSDCLGHPGWSMAICSVAGRVRPSRQGSAFSFVPGRATD